MSAILVTWVRPKALAHDTLIRGFSESINFLNIFKLDAIFSEQSAMDDEDLLVDTMSYREHAEDFTEELIGLDVIFMLYFTLESVHLVEILALMVSSCHEEVFRVESFPSEQSDDNLD
jgi:hypothetical protein